MCGLSAGRCCRGRLGSVEGVNERVKGRLTANRGVGIGARPAVARMRLEAWDLVELMVEPGAGSDGTAGSHRRESQEAACGGEELHD